MDIFQNIDFKEFCKLEPSRRSQFSPRVIKDGGYYSCRIHPKSVQFLGGGNDKEGGYATVERAILVRTTERWRVGLGTWLQSFYSSTDIVVAVKKMKIKNKEERDKVLSLALREIGFLIQFKHPHISKLEGFVEDVVEDRIWLVFPWAENGNLRDFVASTKLEVPERLWLINDVIDGLKYLHGLNPPVCHGDLKSINVLVTSECRAVITDFGSARRIKSKNGCGVRDSEQVDRPEPMLEATVSESTNAITLTKNNFTLRWAAPEVLMDEIRGLEADIWAFGWVCFEVMTSSIPFEDVQNTNVITFHIIKGDLPSLGGDARLSLVRALGSLMVSCWRAAAQDRPTAEECSRLLCWMPKCSPREEKTSTAAQGATLWLELGNTYVHQDNYLEASNAYRKALAMCPELVSTKGKADAVWGLAEVSRLQHDYRKAVALYTECIEICDRISYDSKKSNAFRGLADVHRLQRDFTKARSLYSQSIAICIETNDRRGKADAHWGIAEIYRAQQNYHRATIFYKLSLEVCDEISDQGGRADALWGLAETHRIQSEYDNAIPLYTECAQIFSEIGGKGGRADALWGLADIHRQKEQYDAAVPLYTECVRIYEQIGNKGGRASALWGLAEVYRQQREYSEAEPLYYDCLSLYTRIGSAEGRASAMFGLAENYRLQAEYSRAEPLYSACLRIYEHSGSGYDRAKVLRSLALLEREQIHSKRFLPRRASLDHF